jgi:hypothetical protein
MWRTTDPSPIPCLQGQQINTPYFASNRKEDESSIGGTVRVTGRRLSGMSRAVNDEGGGVFMANVRVQGGAGDLIAGHMSNVEEVVYLVRFILVCLTMSVRPRRPCTVIRGVTMEPRYPWRRDRIDCCYQVFQNMQRDGAEAPLTLIRFSRHRLDYRPRASQSSRSTSLWHMFD